MKEGTQEWNSTQYNLHPTPNKGIAGIIERQRMKEIIQVIKDLKPSPNNCIIEIGCEGGNLLVELEKVFPNADIIGVDISRIALGDAMKKTRNSTLMQHDITKSPFKINGQDVIICSEVLEHIPSPNDLKAIQNISKMAGKDSIIIITVPYETLKNAAKRFLKVIGLMKILFPGIEESKSEWHVQDYSRKDICDKLGKNFEIIHYENILMLHQLIICKVRK